jgi:alpha-tubulin suppressor-like RCC1 family protein
MPWMRHLSPAPLCRLTVQRAAPELHPSTHAGRVFSFGYDPKGCLGHEDRHEGEQPQILPREIEALRVVDVASGSNAICHVLALTYNEEVYQWGLVLPEL